MTGFTTPMGAKERGNAKQGISGVVAAGNLMLPAACACYPFSELQESATTNPARTIVEEQTNIYGDGTHDAQKASENAASAGWPYNDNSARMGAWDSRRPLFLRATTICHQHILDDQGQGRREEGQISRPLFLQVGLLSPQWKSVYVYLFQKTQYEGRGSTLYLYYYEIISTRGINILKRCSKSFIRRKVPNRKWTRLHAVRKYLIQGKGICL